jgi:hypothetical protein
MGYVSIWFLNERMRGEYIILLLYTYLVIY